ncbi:TetR/AcrR family transcriptional regulator [Methylobacterium terricola]|uniref:TetR/AcrR family transcriptional regulator n=1 Tax=Methylobacterium terricola TaxID=2583531 RepID=A0A5C4LGD9_9HYPH|nr:TetR/AcrR family transcriptional regulator [Methylobacterium terricola]TNC13022.1 TetR/AcrR family transcriptional regulator [Methylobacterium terricola]
MNSLPPPSPSPFDRSEQRRLRSIKILQVAAEMFNKKGFGGTSLEDVAAELKISKASIYNYFENKQSLLFHVYLRAFELTAIASERAEQQEGSGLDRLVTFITTQVELMLDPDHGPVAVLSETSSLTPEDRQTIQAMARRQDERVRAFIEQGMRDGSIRAENATRVEFLIMGMLNWIPKWFHIGGEWTKNDISASVVQMIVHGIGAPQ